MSDQVVDRPKTLRAVMLCGVLLGIFCCFPLITIPFGIALIVLSVFMMKGRNWARICLTVFYGLSIYSVMTTDMGLIFSISMFGLSVLCLVISWSPSVNAWFRAIKEGRAA